MNINYMIQNNYNVHIHFLMIDILDKDHQHLDFRILKILHTIVPKFYPLKAIGRLLYPW